MSEPPVLEVQAGNTGAEVSSLSEDQKMIIDAIVWNDMFGDSSNENFKGIGKVEVRLNSIIQKNNTKKEHGDKKDISKRTWNKELNKLVMFSEPFKEGIDEGCMIYVKTWYF